MNKTLDDILGDFNPTEPRKRGELQQGGPISIWLPAHYKSRYDTIQQMSGKRFAKKVRELVMAALDHVTPG